MATPPRRPRTPQRAHDDDLMAQLDADLAAARRAVARAHLTPAQGRADQQAVNQRRHLATPPRGGESRHSRSAWQARVRGPLPPDTVADANADYPEDLHAIQIAAIASGRNPHTEDEPYLADAPGPRKARRAALEIHATAHPAPWPPATMPYLLPSVRERTDFLH